MSKQQVQLTPKQVTIDDLNRASHVGFISEKHKGHIVYIGLEKFTAVSLNHAPMICNNHYSAGKHFGTVKEVVEFLKHRIDEIYVFDTRKELYQWLAEE